MSDSSPGVAPAAATRPLRAFLCHASEDKPAVRALYKLLRKEGIQPWFDEVDLLPGQEWRQEIRKAVRISDVVIVCLSTKSTTKDAYVQKEIVYALDRADEKPEGTIYMIPLRLEACEVPDRLSRWQWVNLYEEGGFERLMRTLRQLAKAPGVAALAIETVSHLPPATYAAEGAAPSASRADDVSGSGPLPERLRQELAERRNLAAEPPADTLRMSAVALKWPRMSVSFNFLHLTDLHLGMDASEDLWPNVEEAFLKDLNYLS
jgi:hypothetical protein